MNIYQVTEQLQLSMDSLKLYKEDGTIDEQTFNDTMEGLQGELECRHKDIACMIKNLESDAEQMEKAILSIEIRRDKVEDKMIWLKKLLLASMIKNDIKKAKYPEFDIVVRESNRVVINDATAIPEQFMRRKETIEPDKSLLREYLKQNEVPGAALETFKSLQVK